MRRGVGPRGVRRRWVRLRPGSVEQRVPVTGLRARGSGELCAAVTIAVLTVIPRRRSCVAGIHGACQGPSRPPPRSEEHLPRTAAHSAARAHHPSDPSPSRASPSPARGRPTHPRPDPASSAARAQHLAPYAPRRRSRALGARPRFSHRAAPCAPLPGGRPCLPAALLPRCRRVPRPTPLTHHSDAHSASVARRLSPSRVRGESRDGGGASSSPRVVVRLARDRAAAEGRSPVGILPCPDGVAPLPPLRVALRPLSACAGSGAPRELPARPLPRGLTAQPAPPRPPLLPPPAPYPASRPG